MRPIQKASENCLGFFLRPLAPCPTVGEQDTPDIQEQARDCSRFAHRSFFRLNWSTNDDGVKL
jgi:hypothetical protein